jgi:(Z)-2-((N-methylformamido)methylene)-5-hydroxybutyrolactone dehydrogenase
MQRYRMYLDGQHVDSASGAWLQSYNPYTGEPWAEIARGNAEDVDRSQKALGRN